MAVIVNFAAILYMLIKQPKTQNRANHVQHPLVMLKSRFLNLY